jgi:hypothetical protein
MEHNYFVIARALHVIAVVRWSGVVVSTALIPAIRNTLFFENRLNLFEMLSGKFGFQAELTRLLTGVICNMPECMVIHAWVDPFNDFLYG